MIENGSYDLDEISKIAFPLECAAAHGVNNPACTPIGREERGRFVYEFFKDRDGRYWFLEYVKNDDGRLIPCEEYVFEPIRAKARAARQRMKNQLDPEQKTKRQNDLVALRKRLTGQEVQKN